MLQINVKFFWGVLVVLLLTIGWGIVESVNAWDEMKRLESIPDTRQLFRYPKPIMDTDLMNVGKAGYEMGIKRNGDNKWEEDSSLLRRVILKPIKINTDDYSKTN